MYRRLREPEKDIKSDASENWHATSLDLVAVKTTFRLDLKIHSLNFLLLFPLGASKQYH